MSASSAATMVISTRRSPAASLGKVAAPETYLVGLPIVPLLPLENADLLARYPLQAPRESKQTFAFAGADNVLPDVREGDVLVVEGADYIVRGVAEYPRQVSGSYLLIVCEQQKVSV